MCSGAFSLKPYFEGVPDGVPEYHFHPTRRWRFDWAWPLQRVALELEGGVWSQGRHVRGAGYERDCEKYNEAQLLGWIVIRATYGQVESGKAAEWVRRALCR